MARPITSITIVGGGTAGWLAATLLRSKVGSRVKITLIESPNVPTVGVGEATVPHMPVTVRDMGIDEQEFFRRCNASFKMGVMFRGWNVDHKGRPIDYMNPFATAPQLNGLDIGYHFRAYGAGKRDYIQSFSPLIDLLDACKCPIAFNGKDDPMPKAGYAYHLDAGKFAGLLAETGRARGVEHILADVDDVELDERGFVAALHLHDHGRHPVDLVIDCTGFKGLVIRGALGEPFEDYSDYLANDRAMALPIPHQDPMKLPAATSSTALGAGWVWNVPLFNRVGTGYVFSSAHRTDDQARDEFLAHLGPRAPEDAEPRVIPIRVGRSRRAWVKNCIALGLSGGFIEPLESTAIHMIDMGLRWLLSYFPDSDYDEATIRRYNAVSDSMFNEVRDFICLHYLMGNRTDDPYWIDARTQLKVPDRLAENLDIWKRRLPGPLDLQTVHLFGHQTFTAVLLGKRVYEQGFGAPEFFPPQGLSEKPWKEFLKQTAARNLATVKHKADHRMMLLALRGELKPGQKAATLPGVAPGKEDMAGEPMLF
ncbi:tryptophan halogenase family protein [Tropicibacter sp. S64]|uniref:tryptophan halogenase family protein n=1 Tax=Tropicibacter sp. S64 TaxID=3415122 RepID=UPI003C79F62D